MAIRNEEKAQGRSALFRILVWISAAAALAGCGGGSGSSTPPPQSASISYPSSSVTLTVGAAATPLVPTASQGLSSFSVAPALPAGLSLDTSNGTISGTPTAVSAAATYTVTATGGGSSASTTVSITVSAASISYPSSTLSFAAGDAITPVVPTASPGLSGFTVAPPLPLGLSLNSSNGTISGTAASASAATTYTVAASGGGASASTTLLITVTAPPSSISYGAAEFDYSANITARTLTPTGGSGATSWTISPSLPPGLSFDTTTGAISGTPTTGSPSTNYVVTAHSGSSQTSAYVKLGVEAPSFGPILDLGHDAAIATIRTNGTSFLSVDSTGHWNLWDYATGDRIASGDLYCIPTCGSGGIPTHLADMAGNTVVLATANGLETLSATSGQVLGTITTTPSWWTLSSDGNYLAAGSSAGLSLWSSSGTPITSFSGDYSSANAFATPSQLQVADGPAGQNIIQTIAVPGGGSTNGPAFNGTFSSWFLDGSRFITTAGTTALVYSAASAQQAAITIPSSTSRIVGQGNWVWTVSPGTLDVFPIATGSTPTTSYSVSNNTAEIPSALTIALNDGTGTLSVVDLSGASPAKADYTLPMPTRTTSAYAATSASQWIFGNFWGVLLDGARLRGTPRYFDLGTAWSIAASWSYTANKGSIAVATASGQIVYFDASGLSQEGEIAYRASNVLLSSDGTALVAAGDQKDAQYNDDASVNVYSLPGGSQVYSWPYSFSSGGNLPLEISLSASGAVLGQLLLNQTSSPLAFTQQANPTTGGTAIFSTAFTTYPFPPQTPTVLVSPNGTLIATSTGIPTSGVNPGANILQNGTVETAVTGLPIGWIDDGDLLVNIYKQTGSGTLYAGCNVYSPSGTSTGPCALPYVGAFQALTSDSIFVPNLVEVLSVSTGNVEWASGDPSTPMVGGVSGRKVIFVSGAKVLVQGY